MVLHPKLKPEQVEMLEQEISKKELAAALKKKKMILHQGSLVSHTHFINVFGDIWEVLSIAQLLSVFQ